MANIGTRLSQFNTGTVQRAQSKPFKMLHARRTGLILIMSMYAPKLPPF